MLGRSTRWNVWHAFLDYKTCLLCWRKNGTIYAMDAEVEPTPPIHENCRCTIQRLVTIAAGTATENGENGADWFLINHQRLPSYYISKEDADKLGWKAGKKKLSAVAPGKMLAKGIFQNAEGKLPDTPERVWYEADINYRGGNRNKERIVFFNDGLVFVTYDHFKTFLEVI